MADITTLLMTPHATEVANKMKESGVFEDALAAARFGMAYTIKYYLNDVDTPEKIEKLDKIYVGSGTTYNAGSVDQENFMGTLISMLYPGCTTPYRYMRVLMCFGLNKLGDLLEEGRLFPISDNM